MTYGDKILKHFANPQHCRAMEKYDGAAMYRSPVCGDTVWVYIRVENEHISDVSFQAAGCPASIACASMLTEMVHGMHVDDAAMVTDEHIVEALGGLPDGKADCSAIAARALHEAIYDYVFKIEERKAESGTAR